MLADLPGSADRAFIEDYFSHQWEDPRAAATAFSSVRGGAWQGSGRNLKERTIPTYADGIAAGLKPLHPNIVDGEMAYLANIDRFIATNRIFDRLRQNGTVKYFVPGKQPDGWAELQGLLAAKTAPVSEDVAIPMRAYAPADVARVYNNTLHRGFWGTDLAPAYDKLMRASNAMTSAELSFSLFHANTMATEAMFSQIGKAAGRLRHGNPLGAIKDFATFPGAPVANYLSGRKMAAEYLVPGSRGEHLARAMNLLTQAGMSPIGRGEAQYFAAKLGAYRSFRDFGDALEQAAADIRSEPIRGYVRQLARNTGRVLDTMAAPLFDHVIPRLKAGAAFERMRDWLEQHPTASHEEQLAAARDISDSIDNRFGELVYDNLMWHRLLKQGAQVMIRAVGWDLGTHREIEGGLADIGRGRWTPRTEYLIGLAIGSVFLNGIATYLKTGQVPSGMDFFAYRTGAKNPDGTPERAMLPGYAREYVSLLMNAIARGPAGAAGSYAWGKVASLWHTAWELFTNRDWRDDPIGPPNAGITTRRGRAQLGEFLRRYMVDLLSRFVPISLRNVTGLEQSGDAKGLTAAEKALAIRKAPFAVQNPAAARRFFDRVGEHPMTPERKWTRKLARERRAAAQDRSVH